MNTEGQFGSSSKFKLEHAILIYAASSDGTGDRRLAATSHKVDFINHKPVIIAGHPVTLEAVEQLATGLGHDVGDGLLPANILSVSFSRLIWWCPAARRRIWFNPDSNVKDKVELKKLNGRFACHPALMFIAVLFALTAGRRVVVVRQP